MSGGWRTSSCALLPWRRRFASRIVLLSLAAGLALTGCAGVIPTTTPSALRGGDPRGGAVAFESVEGVPTEVFHRFVKTLNEEAVARQIAVAARGSEASYRIRSYLALDAAHGAIDWAWDVYDSEQHRVLRLNGAETVGTQRAWAAADDRLLRRIAQTGLQQLAAFLATGPAAPGNGPAAPSSSPGGAAVAFASER
jgi:hypothetical protein